MSFKVVILDRCDWLNNLFSSFNGNHSTHGSDTVALSFQTTIGFYTLYIWDASNLAEFDRVRKRYYDKGDIAMFPNDGDQNILIEFRTLHPSVPVVFILNRIETMENFYQPFETVLRQLTNHADLNILKVY